MNRWMSGVKKEMKSKGTEGKFSAAAHRAGKSTSEFTREQVGKRARLAAAFASARKH